MSANYGNFTATYSIHVVTDYSLHVILRGVSTTRIAISCIV